MSRPCNHFGFSVPLSSGGNLSIVTGALGTFIEYEPLLTLFPNLKKRENRLDVAASKCSSALRGLSLLQQDGTVCKVSGKKSYVSMNELLPELLYERFSRKSSEVMADLVNQIFQFQATEMRSLLKRVQHTSVSEELSKETPDSSLQNVALTRPWLPEETSYDVKSFLGVYYDEVKWRGRRKTYEYVVNGMRFEDGFILSLPHYGKRITDFYMSNDQIKDALCRIGHDFPSVNRLLKSLFGERMMWEVLNSVSTERRLYNEYYPESDSHRVSLVHASVIHSTFSQFTDHTCQIFCVLLEQTQSLCGQQRGFFEEFMKVSSAAESYSG